MRSLNLPHSQGLQQFRFEVPTNHLRPLFLSPQQTSKFSRPLANLPYQCWRATDIEKAFSHVACLCCDENVLALNRSILEEFRQGIADELFIVVDVSRVNVSVAGGHCRFDSGLDERRFGLKCEKTASG